MAKKKQASRPIVDQWMRDNAPHLKTYYKNGVRGFYAIKLGAVQSLKTQWKPGEEFKSWGDVLEYLIFAE